jgi:hypothetical protein
LSAAVLCTDLDCVAFAAGRGAAVVNMLVKKVHSMVTGEKTNAKKLFKKPDVEALGTTGSRLLDFFAVLNQAFKILIVFE